MNIPGYSADSSLYRSILQYSSTVLSTDYVEGRAALTTSTITQYAHKYSPRTCGPGKPPCPSWADCSLGICLPKPVPLVRPPRRIVICQSYYDKQGELQVRCYMPIPCGDQDC